MIAYVQIFIVSYLLITVSDQRTQLRVPHILLGQKVMLLAS